MPSKRQIEAQQKNAQLSTGPKNTRGTRRRPSQRRNPRLTAQTLVLPGEHKAEFQALFDSLAAEHQPATPTEEILVGQLAMATCDCAASIKWKPLSFHSPHEWQGPRRAVLHGPQPCRAPGPVSPPKRRRFGYSLPLPGPPGASSTRRCKELQRLRSCAGKCEKTKTQSKALHTASHARTYSNEDQ